MMKYDENETFNDEQLEFISNMEKEFGSNNDYLSLWGITSKAFVKDIPVGADKKYSFRKTSEVAVGDNTVISKIMVFTNSKEKMRLIMYTQSTVDRIDSENMEFSNIRPVYYRTADEMDVAESHSAYEFLASLQEGERNSLLTEWFYGTDHDLLQIIYDA